MNIKELKEFIKDLPDDAPVLFDNGDHGAWVLGSPLPTVVYDGKQYTEDIWTEESTPENCDEMREYGKRIPALYFR